jgi:hypothetical protein
MYDPDALSDLDLLRSRYEILGRLGHDGGDEIFGVQANGTNRHYAVRVMAGRGPRHGQRGALHGWQAQSVRRLHHPHLVPLHAVHHLQGGAVALAMERQHGVSLAERIGSEGPLTVAEAETILRRVAGALAYLHAQGIVHRGVRPQSIFLDPEDGGARLAHFAIDRGREPAPPGAAHPAVVRSFAYLAPEQVAGTEVIDRRVDPRTDLYSLGLVAYAMLAGVQPWSGANVDALVERRAADPLPPLPAVRPDAPEYLCRAIEGCLQPNPRRRWRSAEELLARLDRQGPEQAATAPMLDWRGAAERLAGLAGEVRSAAARNLPDLRGPARLAASGAIVGLVALAGLRAGGGPPAAGGSETATMMLPGFAAHPPASYLLGGPRNPGDAIDEGPGVSPAPAWRAPSPAGRPRLLGDPVPGGLASAAAPAPRAAAPRLLGDPVRRQ